MRQSLNNSGDLLYWEIIFVVSLILPYIIYNIKT